MQTGERLLLSGILIASNKVIVWLTICPKTIPWLVTKYDHIKTLTDVSYLGEGASQAKEIQLKGNWGKCGFVKVIAIYLVE